MDTREDQNISKDYEKKTLKCADQAEILRSYQRDIDFISQLQEKLSNLLHDLKNYRTLFRYPISDIPARLIYFVFTSGMGNQTLGEEYTGIVQANLKNYSVPSLNVYICIRYELVFIKEDLIKYISLGKDYQYDS